MGVKNIFYDKMDFRLVYFHVKNFDFRLFYFHKTICYKSWQNTYFVYFTSWFVILQCIVKTTVEILFQDIDVGIVAGLKGIIILWWFLSNCKQLICTSRKPALRQTQKNTWIVWKLSLVYLLLVTRFSSSLSTMIVAATTATQGIQNQFCYIWPSAEHF